MNVQKSLPLNQTFSGRFCIIKLRAFFLRSEIFSPFIWFISLDFRDSNFFWTDGSGQGFVHLLEGN